VRAIKFLSTHHNTLSTSTGGGPPTVVGPPDPVDLASSRGRCLVLAKSVGRTGPHMYITYI
jgi:hypothetical protein